MKNIKILICSYKLVKLPSHEFFLPIQGGASVSECSLPYQFNNVGVNISNKKKSYCELTCYSRIWKILRNIDILGWNHYRWYFDFEGMFKYLASRRKVVSVDLFLSKLYMFPNLGFHLKDNDTILPNTRIYPYNMAIQYVVSYIVDDWNIMKEIVIGLLSEYIPVFERLWNIVIIHRTIICSLQNRYILNYKH